MHFFFPLQGLHHLSFISMPYRALQLRAEAGREEAGREEAGREEAGREEETMEARGESATVALATEVKGEAEVGGEGLDSAMIEEVEVRPVRPGAARLLIAGDARPGKLMADRRETLWCLVLLFLA